MVFYYWWCFTVGGALLLVVLHCWGCFTTVGLSCTVLVVVGPSTVDRRRGCHGAVATLSWPGHEDWWRPRQWAKERRGQGCRWAVPAALGCVPVPVAYAGLVYGQIKTW